MLNISSKVLKTDVTCIKCFKNYILAGIGNILYIFNINGNLLQTYSIFHGQKIHDIVPNSSNKIAVFGGNIFKIVEFDFLSAEVCKDLSVQYCKDWIFGLQWLDTDTQIATIFAHNFVSLWSAINVTEIKSVTSVECKARCTLYSASLINSTWNQLYVLSGTVFGQVLIWKPAENYPFAPVLYKLEGHDGAIFSITYSQKLNSIVTTSDDRTVRIWTVSENFFIEENSSNKVTLYHTMYGHIARVFRCKIIKNFIVTAGEDSFVHVWNFNGELIRKFETHQGGCVWALECCIEKSLIITGGGDSGISLYPLEVKKEIETVSVTENDTPRSLKLTAENNVVVIMDSGWLKYYKTEEKQWIDVYLHDDLKSYAILEITENRNLIALAGIKGTIYIYKENNSTLCKLCSYDDTSSKRIFSFNWLDNNQFLTTTVDGIMNIWYIEKIKNNYEIKRKQTYILPPCKERWATCATISYQKYLTVGDRKGNIHMYELTKQDCIQSLKKSHCHLGVTSLHYFDNYLYSLGRNGMLNKYSLNSTGQLLQVSSDKLPISWLASKIRQDNTNLLTGFSGSNFIVYNLDQRRIILELNCGGGHRSWDMLITKSNVLNFYFIKEKKLNKFSENWTNILTKDLVSGFHTKEINCGAMITVNDEKFLFLSGGEDTTLRLSLISLKSKFSSFSTIYALKSHLSSIRCISICPLENNKYLIFSGGGRAQIIMQKLQINYNEQAFANLNCYQLDSYYKQLNDNEAETRIMDLVTINLGKNILLIAGSSDGTLKCYIINLEEPKLKFITQFVYGAKCVIRLSHVVICNHHIIISMATDGKLVFWDFTEFCDTLKGNLKPFYTLQANQSGINSFCIKKINDETYLFATGGDDNAIILNAITFDLDNNSLIPHLKSNWSNTVTHGAQITGVFIYNNYILTTSIDQHISVFKYTFENNKLKAEFLSQYCSTVSDVQGMNCALHLDEIFVCIYGKGIEVLNLNIFK